MKNLYLLRGLPGSGKSTLAEQLGGSHFETDKYFMVKMVNTILMVQN
jgi:adenylate kinase family enzyme